MIPVNAHWDPLKKKTTIVSQNVTLRFIQELYCRTHFWQRDRCFEMRKNTLRKAR